MHPERRARAEEHYEIVERSVQWSINHYGIHQEHFDDLISDANVSYVAFVSQWEAAGRSEDDFRSVAFTVIKRSCIDYLRDNCGRSDSTPAFRRFKRTLSINVPIDEEGAVEFGDLLPDLGIPDPSDSLIAEEMTSSLYRACPTERHRSIIRGVLAGKTFAEIGKQLGVTESRISQIFKQIRMRADYVLSS